MSESPNTDCEISSILAPKVCNRGWSTRGERSEIERTLTRLFGASRTMYAECVVTIAHDAVASSIAFRRSTRSEMKFGCRWVSGSSSRIKLPTSTLAIACTANRKIASSPLLRSRAPPKPETRTGGLDQSKALIVRSRRCSPPVRFFSGI
jgi:hypothetical protein